MLFYLQFQHIKKSMKEKSLINQNDYSITLVSS